MDHHWVLIEIYEKTTIYISKSYILVYDNIVIFTYLKGSLEINEI